jgi:hypothetical protein
VLFEQLDHPTAADDFVVLVKDCGLSRRDGALRLVKDRTD